MALVQQSEGFWKWLTTIAGSERADVKWPPWRAGYLIGNIFEICELNAIGVNVRHMKVVPGCGTDVKDVE